MKLFEKITTLRKQKGYSQEELANELDVSRQAVSKWELGVSIPDIDKIILMSELFNVTTDYLLKDDTLQDTNDSKLETIKRVSKKEVIDFFALIKKESIKIAIGVLLCILSPATLILLCGFVNSNFINTNIAVIFGLVILFLFIISSLIFFIPAGIRFSKFNYLENSNRLLNNDAVSYLTEQKNMYTSKFIRNITIGVVICILSVIPLLVVANLNTLNLYVLLCVDIILLFVGIACLFFIPVGNYYGWINKLLKDTDHFKERKSKVLSAFSSAYWLITTAIFLFISFVFNLWGSSWLIWPIAGVLFAAIYVIIESVFVKENKK